MFLKHKGKGDLVEVMELDKLFDPFQGTINGRFHAGEEMPEPTSFNKADLCFPSDEDLPRCWVDPNYRQ